MPQIENKVLELKKISWEDVKKFELNGLKDITNRDVSKLKKSIIKRGFFSPLMVWKNLVFDGAGRVLALKKLEKDGYKIPEIPCQFVEAKNLSEAKIYALQMSSQHGEITQESLYEFAIDIPEVETLTDEVDFYEFNQEFGDVEAEESEKDDLDNKYSDNEGSVLYEPSDKKWSISDLFEEADLSILENIEKLQNKDLKIFLKNRFFCLRKLKFNKIADYYTNQASKEEQEIFEKLALVLLDKNQLIENGYAEIIEEIKNHPYEPTI